MAVLPILALSRRARGFGARDARLSRYSSTPVALDRPVRRPDVERHRPSSCGSQEEAMSADQGISAEAIGKLRAAVRGGLIGRDHEGYEEARRVYNAMIARHPAVIVQAEDAADVIASVRFAGEHQLPLAGRGPQRPGIRHLRRRRRYRSRGDAQRARGSEAGYRAGRRRRRAGGARPRGARLRLGHARRTHLDDRCGGGSPSAVASAPI